MKTKLKNILYIIIVLTLFTSSLIIDTHAQPKKDIVEEKKLTICHYPPGSRENVQEIEINENSLNTHLEHGDYILKEDEECKAKAIEVPIPIPTLPKPINPPIAEPVNPEPTNSPTQEPTNLPTYEPTSYPSPQTLGVTTQANSKEEKQANYSSLKPVYRFLNIKGVVRHIYIIDYGEYLKTLKLTNEWKFEGIAFYAWMDSVNDKGEVTCNSDKAAVYRFFSIVKENHVFTIDEGERITLVNDPAYEYEGIKFCVYRNQIGGTNPVYRFWHFINDKHFYTISEVEKDDLISKYNRGESQWRFEDIKFYAVKPTDYYKNKLINAEKYKKYYSLSQGTDWCGGYKYSIHDGSKFIGEIIYNPLENKIYELAVENGFRESYYNKSGETCKNLGLPIMNTSNAAPSKNKVKGIYQLFEKGGIYYSKEYGTHSVYGIIYQKYENMEKPGGTNGKYGFPKGEVFKWEEQNMNCQWFEGGKLCEYEIAVCGNKVVESRTNEQCDDGNTVSGDGCSNLCKSECPAGYIRRDGMCMKDFLGGSVHPIAMDANCVDADIVYSGVDGNDDYGNRPDYGDFHYGVDIRSLNGGTECKVNSVADGIVSITDQDENKANYVDVQHTSSNMVTRYIHGADILVTRNSSITINSYIFTMGCTGRCDARHLHFELFPNLNATYSTQIDPQQMKNFGYLGNEHDSNYLPNYSLDLINSIFKVTKQY
jgi:cysteine-rich repeat protein